MSGFSSFRKSINLLIWWLIIKNRLYWKNIQLWPWKSLSMRYNLKMREKKKNLRTIEYKLLNKNKVMKKKSGIQIQNLLPKDNTKEKYLHKLVIAIPQENNLKLKMTSWLKSKDLFIKHWASHSKRKKKLKILWRKKLNKKAKIYLNLFHSWMKANQNKNQNRMD